MTDQALQRIAASCRVSDFSPCTAERYVAERVSCLLKCSKAWTVVHVTVLGSACSNMLYTLVHEYSVVGCRNTLRGTSDQQIALQHPPGAGTAFHLEMSKVSFTLCIDLGG